MKIEVIEETPGLEAARRVESLIRKLGIHDVQLLFDNQIKMWALVQVKRHTGILLPKTYAEGGVQPYILWWCKTNEGTFRLPSEQDVHDLVAVLQRAEKIWAKPEGWLADKLDEQSAEKDLKHRLKQKEMVKSIAPRMKKAIREERW